MRPLTETETQTLFRKLAEYTGASLENLILNSQSPNDRHTFRLIGSRVFYVLESIANLATSITRSDLALVGTCIGKFTKAGKFKIHISALDILAEHARFKVWVKSNGEMPFLYGANIAKMHVARWSEDCPQYQGVVIMSVNNDSPLGFGVTARSTAELRRLDPTGIAVFRQADLGEYLREEDSLFAA